jgi:hypothetical protein
MKLITKIVAATISSVATCIASISYSSAAPDPTTADSPAPATQYASPFKDYRPLGDDKRVPWRAANDEVGKIGGWRVYLRESQEASKAGPDASPAAKPTPANSPAPGKPKASEHTGHHQHK